MGKQLTSKTLANFEANRDVWQELLEGVREIKAGKRKQRQLRPSLNVVRVRIRSGLYVGVWSCYPISNISWRAAVETGGSLDHHPARPVAA